MAATRTAIVPFRQQTAAPIVIRRSGGKRKGGGRKKGKTSPSQIREQQRTRSLLLGGLSSLAFGVLQKRIFNDIPSIPNVPDSLTYGALGCAAGVLLKSEMLVEMSSGMLFAGLNHIGQAGFGAGGTALGGDDSGLNEYEAVSGGDFSDL